MCHYGSEVRASAYATDYEALLGVNPKFLEVGTRLKQAQLINHPQTGMDIEKEA
jgi:hypothetical protein